MVLLVNNRCEIIGDLPCKRDRYQNISISEASFKDGLRNERFYTEKATVWKYRGTMKSLIYSVCMHTVVRSALEANPNILAKCSLDRLRKKQLNLALVMFP